MRSHKQVNRLLRAKNGQWICRASWKIWRAKTQWLPRHLRYYTMQSSWKYWPLKDQTINQVNPINWSRSFQASWWVRQHLIPQPTGSSPQSRAPPIWWIQRPPPVAQAQSSPLKWPCTILSNMTHPDCFSPQLFGRPSNPNWTISTILIMLKMPGCNPRKTCLFRRISRNTEATCKTSCQKSIKLVLWATVISFTISFRRVLLMLCQERHQLWSMVELAFCKNQEWRQSIP